MFVKLLNVCLILFFLNACGLGVQELDIPGERPNGKILGKVLGGLYSGGTVSVYTLNDAESRTFLASSAVQENGEFVLEFAAKSQPVLVEVDGGSYLDPGTLKIIKTEPNFILSAVLMYVSGEEHNIPLTPFTHLAAGSILFYKQASNTDVDESIITSINKNFIELYSIDITNPEFTISFEQDTGLLSVQGDDKQGLLISALAQIAYEESQTKEDGLKKQFHLASLTDLMYEDIRSDGILNGKSYFLSGGVKTLAFGNRAMDTNFYRLGFAFAMKKTLAQTPFTEFSTSNEYEDYVLSVAQGESQLFDELNNDVLSTIIPEIELMSDFPGEINSEFALDFRIENTLKLNTIKLTVDEAEFDYEPDAIFDPTMHLFSVKLDTGALSDGDYDLTIIAHDAFGNTGSLQLPVRIDNTPPLLTIDSAKLTNNKDFLLKGNFSETGSGISKISVNNNDETLVNDEQWSKAVSLQRGINRFIIGVEDNAGNYTEIATEVVLDDLPPRIEYPVSPEVRFSNNDGSYFNSSLSLQNEIPLYIESTQLSLSGLVENKDNLSQANIPYLAFTVSDAPQNGLETTLEALSIQYRYLINDQEILPWHSKSLEQQSGELLLPLVSEVLSNDWYKVGVDDVHKLEIRVSDKAGNTATQQASFKTQFYAPPLNIQINEALDSVNDGGFDDRSNYIGQEVVAVNYSLFNPTDRTFHIRVDDDSEHSVTQTYEEVFRVNKVKLHTREVWRKGFIKDLDKECPTVITEDIGRWSEIQSIWNFVGGEWVKKEPSESFEIINVNTDAPSPLETTDWVDFQTTDSDMEYYRVSLTGFSLHYDFDYIVNYLPGFVIPTYSQPGVIKSWKQTTGDSQKTCPDVSAMKTRMEYSYLTVDVDENGEEVSYPKNNITVKSDEATFSTSRFAVLDEGGEEIFANDGWFEIPANHTVNIVKYIQTPLFKLHTDDVVADLDSVENKDELYQRHSLDKEFTWSIGQNLLLDVQFDPADLLDAATSIRQHYFQEVDKQVVFSRD